MSIHPALRRPWCRKVGQWAMVIGAYPAVDSQGGESTSTPGGVDGANPTGSIPGCEDLERFPRQKHLIYSKRCDFIFRGLKLEQNGTYAEQEVPLIPEFPRSYVFKIV